MRVPVNTVPTANHVFRILFFVAGDMVSGLPPGIGLASRRAHCVKFAVCWNGALGEALDMRAKRMAGLMADIEGKVLLTQRNGYYNFWKNHAE
jgi:hypothetical protein